MLTTLALNNLLLYMPLRSSGQRLLQVCTSTDVRALEFWEWCSCVLD